MSPIAPSRVSFVDVPSSWMTTPVPVAHRSKSSANRWFVTRCTSSILCVANLVEDPVDHRPASNRQELLRDGVRERLQPRRITGGEDEGLHRANAVLGDDRGDQLVRRDVERGIPCGEARRDLARVALLDRDLGTGRRCEIDRRGRCDDIQRQAVVRSKHGERVGADLVRCVAVRRNAVCAGDDHVDLAACHQRRGCRVCDHRMRDAECLELPRGEAGTLKQGARLAYEHVLEHSSLPGRAQRADRGSVAAGRKPARVAVRERAGAGAEEICRVRGHALAA